MVLRERLDELLCDVLKSRSFTGVEVAICQAFADDQIEKGTKDQLLAQMMVFWEISHEVDEIEFSLKRDPRKINDSERQKLDQMNSFVYQNFGQEAANALRWRIVQLERLQGVDYTPEYARAHAQ